MHHSNRANTRAARTRARTRDIDQIYEDIQKLRSPTDSRPVHEHVDSVVAKPPAALDPDLPGLGQFYCIHCAKYFISQDALTVHAASKPHKKRVKELKVEPYSQTEAEAAVGLRTDNSRKPKTFHEGIFSELVVA
ncbi:hypothetical protein HDU83_001245 [Entophlyctis luteolus]|nr:hypothetical protein HDU83_001245 [Entophlyctis luteolus]